MYNQAGMEDLRAAFESVSVYSTLPDTPRSALPQLVAEFPAGVKVDAHLQGIIRVLDGSLFPPKPLVRNERSEVDMCKACHPI